MVITYGIASIASAALLAAIGLVAGYPLWSVFLLYMFGGTLGIVGRAMLICFIPPKAVASKDHDDALTSPSRLHL